MLGDHAARKVRQSFDAASRERAFHDRLARLLGTVDQHDSLRRPGGLATRPLVSVIIIFFNAERFLRDAIESVLFQSYDRWELLLVDDGSSDGSTGIARGYAAGQPRRIRYLDHQGHQNRGMSATRNLGISNAAGSYVAFLDADDVWLPFKLARQVAILEAHPEAGMVCGAAEDRHGWTGRAEDLERDHTPDLGVAADRIYDPPSLSTLLYPLGAGTAPCPSDLDDQAHGVRSRRSIRGALRRREAVVRKTRRFWRRCTSANVCSSRASPGSAIGFARTRVYRR